MNDLGLDVEVWGVYYLVSFSVGLHGEVSTSLHLHHLGGLLFGMWFHC